MHIPTDDYPMYGYNDTALSDSKYVLARNRFIAADNFKCAAMAGDGRRLSRRQHVMMNVEWRREIGFPNTASNRRRPVVI